MAMKRIYTRTGDEGETGLFGGGRVPKSDPRVEAYGAVDELNAVLGVALAALGASGQHDIAAVLEPVQGDLLALGAHLATPESGGAAAHRLPPLPRERIAAMEAAIDRADDELPPLTHFVLPGGSDAGAALHLARTVCRRAERRVVALAGEESVDADAIRYLNRLSDLLFTLARLANQRSGSPESTWAPAPRDD